MSLKALIIFCFFLLCTSEIFSQDYFSYGGGNFCGITQLVANPAAAADNRLKVDVLLGGFDLNLNNSWFAIKREALQPVSGSIFTPASLKLPQSWKNLTPGVPGNIYKNFIVVPSGASHAAILETRILMPSLMLQLDQKQSIAFTWSIRQIFNTEGISEQLANLFEKELDLSVTQNNRIMNKNLSITQMAWAEYGVTYARVLKDKNKHFVKAGITPKLLQGLESAFLSIKDLDFLLSTKDTMSYFKGDIAYARSANFSSPVKNNRVAPSYYRFVSRPALGIDIGIIYEWRPDHNKYRMNTGGNAWRKDLNKYKLKLGASLVDLGRLTFDKEGKYYDLNLFVQNKDINKLTTLTSLSQFDSLLRADYSAPNQQTKYSMLLPAALNTQVDYAIKGLFYINLSAHVTNFFKSDQYRVHNYTSFCIAPRIEHYWFNVSLPLAFNSLSARRFNYLYAGLNLRAGPLSIGTSNLAPLISGDISSFSFYTVLRFAIPHNLRKDKDHDGIADKKDACADLAGLAAFKGCPDRDGDLVMDSEDLCPDDKGTAASRGCPDLDGDSIPDRDDLCRESKGTRLLKGCPDRDGDGVADVEDLCPSKKGTAFSQGCPDTDGDLVHDGIDACETLPGAIENKGCPWPDTDNDGVIDRLDSCKDVPGLATFKGCPDAVKIAPAEKNVLLKAFANLKFETAKDIIKPSSFVYLDALATLLMAHKNEWRILLSGHTDNNGSEKKNLLLSEKRSKAVQNYLIKKGVPKENTVVEWFGSVKPVGDNLTAAGREKNRRVEMKLIPKQ